MAVVTQPFTAVGVVIDGDGFVKHIMAPSGGVSDITGALASAFSGQYPDDDPFTDEDFLVYAIFRGHLPNLLDTANVSNEAQTESGPG